MVELLREKYLSRIRPFYDDVELIKVITGVRRCGKSTIMAQISREIAKSREGASIAYIDLDSRPYRDAKDADELERIIDALVPATEDSRYVFIDEIQNIEGFEPVINSYRQEGVSIFITGSNSYLLSGELVTKLTGRYIEFRVMPFSFSEVRDYVKANGWEFEPESSFRDYMVNGGFPKRFSYADEESQEVYLRSIVEEIVKKDVLSRNRIREMPSFERVLEYVLATPSATVSSTSVSGYLRNEKIGINPNTVNRYLGYIFDSRLASRCLRYDVKGKKALKTLYKSYIADPALYTYHGSVRGDARIGSMLENIVYNELISRGYDVSTGAMEDGEIDFIVTRSRQRAYVQVTYLMASPETEKREFSPLLRTRDAYPKYVISMDPMDMSRDGVKHLNLVSDFLLGDGFELRAPVSLDVGVL